jgi:hypothetical protein
VPDNGQWPLGLLRRIKQLHLVAAQLKNDNYFASIILYDMSITHKGRINLHVNVRNQFQINNLK